MTEIPDKYVSESLLPHQEEFIQLTELAGLNIDPDVVRVLIEMLNMNIPPQMVYELLKLIKRSKKIVKAKKPKLPQ